MKRSALLNRLAPLALLASLTFVPASALCLAAGEPTPVTKVALADQANRLWENAKQGDWDAVLRAMNESPEALPPSLRAGMSQLRESIQKRETMRAARVMKVQGELSESLQGDETPAKVSDSLKHAVELHELAPDAAAKAAVLASEPVKKAIARADNMARAMEVKGEWLWAAELFSRLNILLDTDAKYKPDIRRLNDRLSMLRLYAPKRLWELRNTRREIERQTEPKLAALPPFNSVGEGYQSKLKDVSRPILLRALQYGGNIHVEQIPMRELLIGGLEAVRTMSTTQDLRVAFEGLDNAKSREMMVGFLDEKIKALRTGKEEISDFDLADLLDALVRANDVSVKIPESALLHEFGNGAFDRLDEFSAIIWPDELARFKRMTDSSFPGVGIQIQLDEETQLVKVITPVDNSPAAKAGIRPGDYIKKINNDSALGMSVDQAVEQITGREGTKVRLTVEREGEDLTFELTRAKIPNYTIKGWKRQGAENNWDWMIDRESKVGYVRITGFNERTSADLANAIGKMKSEGAQGLIIDLRFNPGGLLTEAVNVVNTFVDSGEVVYTQRADGRRVDTHFAEPDKQRVKGMPLVVLVNDGSASASEIVSGALHYYADQGKVKALVLGHRTFGKGSVQNVIPLPPTAALKVTTQYYYLPDGKIIHRREKATTWGVDPHLKVEMLPRQVADALTLRSDADLQADAKPVARRILKDDEDIMYRPDPKNFPPDPNRLMTDGIDLQLQTALVLLQAQVEGKKAQLANVPPPAKNPG